MPLRGEGAMRLTTSRYYTPSGRSIQALGVSPNIIVEQPRRKNSDLEAEETRRIVVKQTFEVHFLMIAFQKMKYSK
jgi:C-terminal processing protease CtpA/Prc